MFSAKPEMRSEGLLRKSLSSTTSERGSNSTIELLLLLVFFFCEIPHYFLHAFSPQNSFFSFICILLFSLFFDI